MLESHLLVVKPTIIISCSEKKKTKKAVTALLSENGIDLAISRERKLSTIDKKMRDALHGRSRDLVLDKANINTMNEI